MNEPLSLSELQRMVPNAKVMKYGALEKYVYLPRLPLIILYETQPNFGHWIAVLETPEGVEHFDSYGIIPDNELNWVPEWLKGETGQNVKRLLSMLYQYSIDTGKKINYNNHRFQGRDTSTCGRWCALRIMFMTSGTDQFYRAVKSVCKSLGMIPDELVSIAI